MGWYIYRFGGNRLASNVSGNLTMDLLHFHYCYDYENRAVKGSVGFGCIMGTVFNIYLEAKL